MRMVLVSALAVVVVTSSTASADEVATALSEPQRLPRRVHIARVGHFGLTLDGRIGDTRRSRRRERFDDVPVVEIRPGRARVVHDEDSARMLLWIDEKDLAWGIARKTRIAGKGDVGVWLLPGAPVTTTGTGARRRIKARFASGLDVALSGVVPAEALVRSFPPAERPPAEGDQHSPSIHLAPGGHKLAGFPDGLSVRAIGPRRDGWTLVEHRGRWLEVRGWSRAADLGEPVGVGGVVGGSAYGVTDTDEVDVNAGVCLFASVGGPIAGVELARETRYSPDNDGTWWELYVRNAWGTFTVHARADRVDARGKPTFAPCPVAATRP